MKTIARKFSTPLSLIVVLFLIVWRAPMLFTAPRFWAEDGTMFFSTAYNHGVLAGLLAQHDGYLSLAANMGGAFSALLPLELAPYGTTMVALMVQLTVCALVLTGRSRLWGGAVQRLFLAVGILLLAHGETWLNTANSMHWLCLAVFILLMEPKNGLRAGRRWAYRNILLLAGLASITASFLWPCYLVKAWRSRQREEWVHVCILGATTLVQLAVALSVFGSDAGVASRFAHNRFSFIGVSLFHLVYPFTSQSFFDLPWVYALDSRLTLMLIRVVGPPSFNWPRPSEIGLILTVAVLVAAVAWKRRRDQEMQLLLAAFALVTVLSVLLSIGMESSPRYALAPSFMLLTLFTAEARTGRSIGLKGACLALLGLFLTFSPLDFRNNVCFDPRFPSWREEVARWRLDPGYRLRVWPLTAKRRWEVELTRR